MSLHCGQCNKVFEPRQYNQRHCSAACSAEFYANARRAGVEMLRAQIDDERPGGRYAAVDRMPRMTTGNGAMPPRGPMIRRQEPSIEGNSDVLGVAIGGAGGEP